MTKGTVPFVTILLSTTIRTVPFIFFLLLQMARDHFFLSSFLQVTIGTVPFVVIPPPP